MHRSNHVILIDALGNPLLSLDLNGSAVVIGGAGKNDEVTTRVLVLAAH